LRSRRLIPTTIGGMLLWAARTAETAFEWHDERTDGCGPVTASYGLWSDVAKCNRRSVDGASGGVGRPL
jgi:hypothetical protein